MGSTNFTAFPVPPFLFFQPNLSQRRFRLDIRRIFFHRKGCQALEWAAQGGLESPSLGVFREGLRWHSVLWAG